MAQGLKEIAAIKDKAEAYFSKGKLKDALEIYESIKFYSNKEPRITLRIGDIYRKIGKNNEAINAYKLSVNAFVLQGFVTKAIGVCKVIMDIDPSQTDIQKKIAELYTSKGGVPAEEKRVEEVKQDGKIAEDRVERFPRTPLFSDLTKDELIALISKVKHHAISPGTLIFQEGANGDSIYIINSGTVEIVGKDKTGNDIVLASLKEGDFFGEFGFFSNSRREASVRASSTVNLLEIIKGDVNDIVERHKRVAEVLFDFYKERVVDRLMALSPVFKPLTPADRKEILARLTHEKFEQGKNIINEGEIGDTMFLIKEGKVKVWVKNPEKGTVNMAELEEGDFFGEIALATSHPRIANVTAVADTELVLFSRPMIKDILGKYPEIKNILEDIIKARVADVMKLRGLQSAALV